MVRKQIRVVIPSTYANVTCSYLFQYQMPTLSFCVSNQTLTSTARPRERKPSYKPSSLLPEVICYLRIR
jgi:hypothetical protein